MSKTVRPRRSVLYMPGSNARALEKARALPADGFILDLEDAVAPDAKEIARQQVCAAVQAGGYGQCELVIRVNDLSSAWGQDDIIAAARSGAHAIVLPKVESADTVCQAEHIMRVAGAPDDMAIWCMMETPRGMLEAPAITAASSRLSCLVMGTSDLAKDLNCAHTRERLPFITSLGLCLLAARAHGLTIVDGVYNAFKDEDGLRAECAQGRDMGFDGKTLIHPAQLEIANEVFSPSTAEIDLANRQIAAFEEAERQGLGVAVVDGKIVENLHIVTARQTLAKAEAIAAFRAS